MTACATQCGTTSGGIDESREATVRVTTCPSSEMRTGVCSRGRKTSSGREESAGGALADGPSTPLPALVVDCLHLANKARSSRSPRLSLTSSASEASPRSEAYDSALKAELGSRVI
eukprot:scaffold38619_cov38-Tisochrysis_lutea.AAC.2